MLDRQQDLVFHNRILFISRVWLASNPTVLGTFILHLESVERELKMFMETI